MKINTFNDYYFSPEYIRENPVCIEVLSLDGTFSTITGKEIKRDSLRLKQGICSKSYFIFGGCVSSELSFTVYSSQFDTTLPSGKIQLRLTPTQNGVKLSESSVNLFTGYIETAEKNNDGSRNVTAYDILHRMRNVDCSEWFKSMTDQLKENFHHFTQRQFRTMLEVYMGLDIYSDYTLTWDGAIVPDNKIPSMNGIKVLQELCLVNSVFGYIDGNGKFHYEKITGNLESDAVTYDLYNYDRKTIKVNDSYVWMPGEFICDPNPYINNTYTEETAEERYWKNICKINSNFFVGDDEWIQFMWDCDDNGVPTGAVTSPNLCFGVQNVPKTYYCQEYSVKACMDPTIPIGSSIRINKGSTVLARSYIMERIIDIKNCQVILCTLSAKNGPYNNYGETDKKTEEIEKTANAAKNTSSKAYTNSIANRNTCNQLAEGEKKLTVEVQEIREQLPIITYDNKEVAENLKISEFSVISKTNYDALEDKKDDVVYYVYDDQEVTQ